MWKLVACERTSIIRDGSFLALIKKVASACSILGNHIKGRG